ncbi:MAG: M28 family peptidase, partial [Acidobacteriaceae bacterium]|nr:M28 family peptidase [Acidobacteriaceae bacterium]
MISAAPARGTGFSGSAALEYTRHATSFGERPAGSDALKQCRDWIISQLKPSGGQLSLDSFQAQTPAGSIAMTNIIVKFPGNSGKAIAVTGHYDTKRIATQHFIGANDAGSSTGFLIEFARVAAHMRHPDDIYIVFFDGEEAVRLEWGQTDSKYGSRQLAAKWGADGILSNLRALINVDMIGDKDLDIINDANSSEQLRKLIWDTAAKLGDGKYFRKEQGGEDDDHMPFVDAGVNAVDLLDLDYGPNNSYWHTAQDTMDKLSAHSLQVVGDVVVTVVKQLETQSQTRTRMTPPS